MHLSRLFLLSVAPAISDIHPSSSLPQLAPLTFRSPLAIVQQLLFPVTIASRCFHPLKKNK